MTNVYHDGCLPVIAIDVAIEEKTQVAKMAVATLHKLQHAMQRMKDWREDSVKLKSSIWRMRMALQADDNLDDQRIDPLIAYQISQLRRTNDNLENQVTSLKRALSKAEGDAAPVRELGDQLVRIKQEFAHERERLNDEILSLRTRLRETEDQTSVTLEHHLRDKLLDFARGDRSIEIVLANAIGRIVETVVGLSEELVFVSENLCRFRTKNRRLRLKLDRLRAMLRTRCGDGGAEYRKRIGELSNLATRLLGEVDRLKAICEDANHDDVQDVVRLVESLMSDLKNSLKSEREALIAAGDPDCLRYMRKVVDLRVNLRVLSVELRHSNALLCERSREDWQSSNCWRTVSLLNDFLQKIDMETERLRVEPMHRYCRIGGVSGTRYAARVAELEAIVKRSIGVIAVMKQDSSGMTSAKNGKRATEELADSIERLCRKLRDLEVLDDRASLQGKINRLEASVIRVKLELAARDERIRVFSDEHASVRSNLERDRERHEKIVADMCAENESLREGVNNRKREISELSREREHSTAAMRLMRAEIDAVRKELRNLRDDREALLRETEGMRNILRGRTGKEIEDIIAERDALRGRLDAEVTVLKTKLEIASDENAKLKSIIAASDQAGEERPNKMKSSGGPESEGVNGRDNCEGMRERARDPRDELVERLKAESNETKISLGEANEQIDHLRRALDKAVGDRMRLEGEISDLKSNEQSLTHRLNVRTSVCEAATRESERATAENKALASQVKQLGNENEQLAAELSELKTEKELLARAVVDIDKGLQRRVDEFESERSSLRERISEREDAAKNLQLQLKRVRVELENVTAEVTRVRAENARISGDLEAESLRKGESEERVRVLLTEKNELATRINELNGVSVQALRGRLNKAEAENEYFSIELNKSRLENEKVRAKNALLRVTCDKRERDYGTLRRERDEARGLANEIGSECRVLGNQLRIQRMKYEALRLAAATLYHENNDRKSHLKKIDNPRDPLAKAREPGSAAARNDIKHKRDYSDALCATIKDELGELGDAEFKAESDTRAVHDIKTRIKDKPKSTKLKSLTIADNILELNMADSKPKDRQLARTARRKEENGLSAGIEGPRPFEEVVNVLDGHVAVHIFYKSDHLDCPTNPAIIGDEKNWSAVAVVDRLEVENTALKLELNVLRSSLNSRVMDVEKLRTMANEVENEMQSLRLELMAVKSERKILGSRLERCKKVLETREPARAASKDELTTSSATSNFDLRMESRELRAERDGLDKNNVDLTNSLENAGRRYKKLVAASGMLDEDISSRSEATKSTLLRGAFEGEHDEKPV